MNATRDRRLHWAHPLSILIECPAESCSGQLRLHSAGGRGTGAVGRCPDCGTAAVLRSGVLEQVPSRRRGTPERPEATP